MSSKKLKTPRGSKKDKKKKDSKKDKKSQRDTADESLETLLPEYKFTDIVHEFMVEDTPIVSVTVYEDRAEICRVVNVSSDSDGVQKICINNLRSSINDESLRAEAPDLTILEISVEKKRHIAEKQEGILAEREELTDKIFSLQKEKDLLLHKSQWLNTYSNKALLPKKINDDEFNVMNEEEAIEFLENFDSMLEELDEKNLDIDNELSQLQKKLQEVDRVITNSNAQKEDTKEVVILANFINSGSVEFMFSYIITGASWKSSYDTRMDNDSGELGLTYYGEITNSTGENWDNVEMTLSTATPSLGGEPPYLPTLYVVAYDPNETVHVDAMSDRALHRRSSIVEAGFLDEDLLSSCSSSMEEDDDYIFDIPESNAGHNANTYLIGRPVTIESDGKPRKTIIVEIALEEYEKSYTVIPTKSTSAYLKISSHNPSPFRLLPGDLNIFVNNVFVTTSELELVNPGAALTMYMGVDSNIKVETKPEDVNNGKRGMLKNSYYVRKTQKVTVTNLKSSKSNVNVYYQLPFSDKDSVTVRVLEPASTEYTVDKFSFACFNKNIRKHKTFEVVFTYEVESSDQNLTYTEQCGWEKTL
eukprot:TRINITY_DN1203_c0_g1_i1.p1 TRINITY_DN1203_c0_g1~~TRINITY_DN1203_c0_g1_i1.p1  ORF type:complete len:589 (+),score=130.62 TRINITY_DN1203_c0_g1_i1:52-1818(+)